MLLLPNAEYFRVYSPRGKPLCTEKGHARHFNTHKAALEALREHEHEMDRPWNRDDSLIDEGDDLNVPT